MFGDRHELDVGEPEPLGVRDEPGRNLSIGEEPASLLGDACPRTEVNLVHVHGLPKHVTVRAGRHPGTVAPLVGALVNDRGVRRRQLHRTRHRVGLHAEIPVLRLELVLVQGARANAWNEELPDPRASEGAHLVHPAIPAVEVADHTRSARVRCPHRKRRPADPVDGARPCAKGLPETSMASLVEKVQVELAGGRSEYVGIAALPRPAASEEETVAVSERQRVLAQELDEDAASGTEHVDGLEPVSEDLASVRFGMVAANDDAGATVEGPRANPEYRVRTRVLASPYPRQLMRIPTEGKGFGI